MTKTAMQLGREGIGRPEVKPHQCQQCLKSFSSNHQLVQHIRSFSKIYFVKSVVFLNTILLRMRNITIINLFPHSISRSIYGSSLYCFMQGVRIILPDPFNCIGF